MSSGVTVVIPSIASRTDLLKEALDSVLSQTLLPEAIIVEVDPNRSGAWATRNAGMMKVTTEWTAFLDDDDLLLPHHIEYLRGKADEDGLDLCWGWFKVEGGSDPFPQFRGKQFNPDKIHVFPITVLVRTKFLQTAYNEMGGFQTDTKGSWAAQDLPVWRHAIVTQGARHAAYERDTWVWRHHGNNSSGLPTKGK